MNSRMLVALIPLFLSSTASAELYRWVDQDGGVVYSDTPPPAGAQKAEKRRLTDRVSENVDLPFATQAAAKKYPITLYSNDCGEVCANAKRLLSRRGIPHTLKNPETSPEDAEELKKLVGGLEVPVMVVGKDKPVKGFDEAAWNSALDTAGYPKSGIGVKGALVKESNKDTKDKPKAKAEAQKAHTDKKPGQKLGPYADPDAVAKSDR